MSKTVTLRLKDDVYKKFCTSAENDNRTLANFIVNSTLLFIQKIEYADVSEMAEINNDEKLQDDLKKSREDIRTGRISAVKRKKV